MQSKLVLLDPMRVKPFADQPRKRFRGIKQLAGSIRLVGQITPILVTPCDENGFDAELVDGERRLQACREGKLEVKAIVSGKASKEQRFAMSVAANFCRQEHDCIEIAEAVARLTNAGRTIEDIAGIFGKSTCWVYQHRALLRLHPQIQEMLKRPGDEHKETRKQRRSGGRLTLSLALLLVGLDHGKQLGAAKVIVREKLSMAAARRCVLRIAHQSGVKTKTTSPRSKFMQLWHLMDTTRHRIEGIATLPHAKLTELLATANEREREVLAGQVEQVRDDLRGIAAALRKVG